MSNICDIITSVDELRETVANRIRAEYETGNSTYQMLADKLGVTTIFIAQVTRGERIPPMK
jgi:predicted DNA-binding ArsR family transcriptional regulator